MVQTRTKHNHEKKFQRQKQILGLVAGWILVLSIPVIAFFMFEYIAGNPENLSSPAVITFNILLCYGIYALVMAVTNRLRLTMIGTTVLLYFLAIAEYYVLLYRGRPITPLDVMAARTAANVLDNYQFELTDAMIQMGVVVQALAAAVYFVPFRFRGLKKRLLGSAGLAGGAIILISWILYTGTAMFGIYPNFWDQAVGYEENGYALSTAMTMRYLKVKKPTNYSTAAVEQIANSAPAVESDEVRPKNIIYIMNESWADLSVVGDFSVSEEPMPFIDHLTKNTTRGNLYMSVFGSGTSNSEFEALTGSTMAFLQPGSSAYELYIKEGTRSIVDIMNSSGYHTIAMHPMPGSNWNRSQVYERLGFDEFWTWNEMEYRLLRWCPDDQSDFENIVKAYEQKAPGEDLFIFNVTMQNHGGYDYEDYDSTVTLTDYPGKYPKAEQYLSLLRETDQAFQWLLDYFSSVEEETMIIMFGDHQPVVGEDFYDELYGKPAKDRTLEEVQRQYVTPFLIWTNYASQEETIEKMSANYLPAYILKRAGFPLPAYHNYLLQLYEELPVISYIGIIDREERHYAWDQPTPWDTYLNDYQTLQYNNLFDPRHRVEQIFTPY